MPEIIPRAKAKTPSWIKLFLVFSFVILGGSLFSYFAVGWAQGDIRQETDQVHQEISALATLENQALEKEIKVAQYQINNFSGLLSAHQNSSAFFDLLKSVVHPGVVIQGFNLNLEQERAEIRGQAKNFQDIGEQVLAWREEAKVKEVGFTELSLGEEKGIYFTLDLVLDPALFKTN